jgi:hypothetical protein
VPHPDFACYFSKIRSRFFTSLSEALQRVNPALISDLMLEHEWIEEPRRLSEIGSVIGELIDKVWYNRHQYRKYQIERGITKMSRKKPSPSRITRAGPFSAACGKGRLVNEESGKAVRAEESGAVDRFRVGDDQRKTIGAAVGAGR